MIYMIVMYRLCGFIADIALVGYISIIAQSYFRYSLVISNPDAKIVKNSYICAYEFRIVKVMADCVIG